MSLPTSACVLLQKEQCKALSSAECLSDINIYSQVKVRHAANGKRGMQQKGSNPPFFCCNTFKYRLSDASGLCQ